MGQVYAAEDTRLGRRVALKFLPQELVRDRQTLDRFEREARAASALNHPHICTIHDIGEDEGQPFIAMELLEGQTLKARLEKVQGSGLKAQGLPLDELLRVAEQLADALEAAHAKGILHRDIKPANIFLTLRGIAKLLDFGIAKLAAEPRHAETVAPTTGGAWATGAGVTLGTVGYMSPEQVRGEDVDARADLFSLGVVIYEMATGTAPFRGSTSGAVLGEILTKAQTAPVRLNPEVPADLDHIINRLLEKDRALRCQSATDLRADLERLRRGLASPSTATSPEQASIVVLPFENLSPDPDNAFFADGLTEEIIADLSKVRALRVISRTSAMHYKGATKPLPAIAHELNVRHVLEGSVRRAGNNLRITAQLIDASTDVHLWAEKYSGTNDDIFDLQEQLSRRIVGALRVALTPAEDSALARHTFHNAAAFDCYLRAAYEATLWTVDGLDRAELYLKRGLGIIGEHPAILAGLAYLHTQRVSWGFARDEAVAEAVSLAERALALDPSSPQAHAVRGVQMMMLEGNLPGSLLHLERAVEEAPGDSVSATWLGWGRIMVGQLDVAAVVADRAIERDPLNANLLLGKSLLQFFSGRFGDAERQCAAHYEMSPGGSMFVYWRVVTLAYVGRIGECRAVIERLANDPGDDALLRVALMTERAMVGDRDGLNALVTPPFEATAARNGQLAWNVAACYARLGDATRALAWLDDAINHEFVPAQFLATIDPFLASLRGDPRFEALMDKSLPARSRSWKATCHRTSTWRPRSSRRACPTRAAHVASASLGCRGSARAASSRRSAPISRASAAKPSRCSPSTRPARSRAAASSATRRGWSGWRPTSALSSARPRRAGTSAGSRGARARRCSSARQRATRTCSSRRSASGSRRPPSGR
jgi:serine/threonine protein kinase